MNNQSKQIKERLFLVGRSVLPLFCTLLYRVYLNKGDILFFDEFNVPDHEFFAFRIFTESWYIKTKLIGAVNNYLQTAFMVV